MPARPDDAQSDESQPELLPGLVRATLKQSQAKARATRERKAAQAETAAELPVARVLVDVPLAHLDRPFDFSVPATMADDARPGVRVKVRFAGKETDGFLVERAATTEHTGTLLPLRRVVSPEPVLTPEVATLTAAVAARYAGTRSDVLRLAVPPRHATTEKAEDPAPAPVVRRDLAEAVDAWAEHTHAAAWLGHLHDGAAPRAVWNPPPGADWPHLVAQAALAAPGGVVICVPDGKDVDRVDAALTALTGDRPEHAVLTADLGPAARYRSFLRLARGHRRIAVGTRAAAFAPVPDLSLVVVWDDGDDLHAEPRAPYCHTRETLLLRAECAGAAALVGGFARTVEADQLLRTGWAHELSAPRETVRAAVTVAIAGATDFDLVRDPRARTSRLPKQVHDLLKQALSEGPGAGAEPAPGLRRRAGLRALPHPGALHRVHRSAAPARTHRPARLPLVRHGRPGLGVLGVRAPRAAGAGAGPGAHRRGAGAGVPARAGAHLGARARARARRRPTGDRGGHPGRGAGGRGRLRRGGAARRVAAAGPSRPAHRRGGACAAGPTPSRWCVPVAARWSWATRPWRRCRRWCAGTSAASRPARPASRVEAHLPPASRLATITGEPGAIDDALVLLAAPEAAEVLGPVELPEDEGRSRVVVRVPRHQGAALSQALGDLQRMRSSRKLDPVRIQVDPPSL